MPTSDPVLDIDRLLAPISPDNPCGESLRWDPIWAELSELRKTRTDPVDSSRNKIPDWGQVVKISSELLETRSKDLLLAGWLAESLLRQKGFAGLRDGLKLMHGLMEKYWDAIYPLPDEGDPSIRMAPLTWLTAADSGARLPAVMREVVLAPASDGRPLNWNYWHLRRVSPQATGEKEDVYKRRCAEAEKHKQTFDSAVDGAPIAYYQTLAADMDAVKVEIGRMDALLGQRLANDAPSWRSMVESMSEIRTFVQEVLKRRGGLPSEVINQADGASDNSNGAADNQSQAKANGGPVRSRGDAIAKLEEVAKYFSEAEPHSPVSYLVRRAIRWAGMPFSEVLNELVKDDKLVKQIGETLGIVSGPTK